MQPTSGARYAPATPFPPYAFLPGRDPHPTRDRQGHSYGAPEAPVPYLPPERWRENEPYLLGVDLYNHGFLWEAHEVWEGLWHASKLDALQAEHVQGLIQCAAACLKVPMGQPRGLARLCELGTGRLDRVARETGGSFMGLDVVEFARAMRRYASSAPTGVETRPTLVLDVEDVAPPAGRPMPPPPTA